MIPDFQGKVQKARHSGLGGSPNQNRSEEQEEGGIGAARQAWGAAAEGRVGRPKSLEPG